MGVRVVKSSFFMVEKKIYVGTDMLLEEGRGGSPPYPMVLSEIVLSFLLHCCCPSLICLAPRSLCMRRTTVETTVR